MSSRLGLLLLACNLFVCSIPRCDFLRAAVQHALTQMAAADSKDPVHHCHESPAPESRDMTLLSEAGLCKCELLRFVSTLPMEPVRSVSHARVSPLTWELVYLVKNSRSTFIPAIDPPYPKA